MMDFRPTGTRIGLLGGSFDPPHQGHLIIARDAMEQLGLDQVVFIPASIPPHKQHLRQADSAHRLNMVKLAVENVRSFSASDVELKRGGISYTLDTVSGLRESAPNADFFLIIGSDTLVELHTWHRIGELLQSCRVATLLRPGMDIRAEIENKIQLPDKYKPMLLEYLIDAHRIDISSTEIRRRIAEGSGIDDFVPPAVEQYIRENRLYQE